MNRHKVFVANRVPDYVEEYLMKHCEPEFWREQRDITYNELLKKVGDKEGLLLKKIIVDRNLINHAPKLKVVSDISVGYNNFDLKVLKKKGIMGTHTPGVLNETVADLIFALILSTARRISELDRYVKEGRWEKGDDKIFFGQDVHHSSLGIIGMGRIGECVARRAKLGFNMDVYYYNRNRKMNMENELGVKYIEFDALLKTCDFILLMVPLSDETYHLIDEREFKLMKKNAILINTSRGQTVNEKALIKALEDKLITGAGLDVYETEPIDINNPLLKMPNVVTLPHIGSATEKTRNDMAMLAAQNLVVALQGEIPPDLIPELK